MMNGRFGEIPIPTVRVWSKEDRAYLSIQSSKPLFFCARKRQESSFFVYLIQVFSGDGPE